MTSIKKTEKKKKSKELTLHYFLCLLNHSLGLLQQKNIKSDLIDIRLIICVIFCILNALN